MALNSRVAARSTWWCARLLLSVLALAWSGVGQADQRWDLEALMARRQQVKSASAHFVERKYLHLLMRRLETAGQLRYQAPDYLQKITTRPAPETFELRGDTLTTVRRNGERFSATLSQYPEIAALVEGMRSTLAGDRTTLEHHYTLEFTGSVAAWSLRLIPKNISVRDQVNQIVISGSAEQVTLVEVRERDGDRSEMVITADGP